MKIQLPHAVLNPSLTLDEQVFHWVQKDGVYRAICGGHCGCLTPCPGGYFLETHNDGEARFWRDYFDLERDYQALRETLSPFPAARQAMDLLPGLRVLNQPPWEALAAFITSANNNTVRIRRLLLTLCREAGGEEGRFPSPEQLAALSESRLWEMGFGYRAPYLLQTARAICDGFPLDSLAAQPYSEAHRLLLSLPGVGDKVADCVQLFGLRQSMAFPVDVWVDRLMRDWFNAGSRNRRQIGAYGRELFGDNAGIVQQFLFHCARRGLIPLAA